jgi:cytochrome c553
MESNIFSCLVCHGPNVEGVRQIPRLGGLSLFLLEKRLEQWGEGYHVATELMLQIARTLSASEIDAVASIFKLHQVTSPVFASSIVR